MAQPAAFGLNVDPNTGGLAIAGRIAAIADEAGLEYAGLQDHPYNAGFVDTFSLITWLAASTSRVHLFPNVANLPLRPPAMLAKQAATIDVLSGGRFELGLGAGAFADGIAGMGGPRRTPAEAVAALSEAIDIIRASWAGRAVRLPGQLLCRPGRAARPAARAPGRAVARRARAAGGGAGRREGGRLVGVRALRPAGAAGRAERHHRRRRAGRGPRPGPDHPAVQRDGADHPTRTRGRSTARRSAGWTRWPISMRTSR